MNALFRVQCSLEAPFFLCTCNRVCVGNMSFVYVVSVFLSDTDTKNRG